MSNFYTSSVKSLRQLFIAASALTLVACASATPYQPASELGAYNGFTTQMITNDRARVSFGGNSLTKRETVENYLLYRAAEVAVQNGYENFTLQERDVEANTQTRVTPGAGGGFGRSGLNYDPFFGYSFYSPSYGWSNSFAFSRFGGLRNRRGFARSGFARSGFGFGSSRFGRNGFSPFDNDFDVREITKYRATAEVKFGQGTYSEDERTFNAQEVLNNLSDVIVLPEEKDLE